jgi:isoquinoline 1-oxidoreductase beta subunit
LDEKGVPTALKSHIVGPAIMQRFLQIFPDGVKDGVDDTSVEGIVEPIYDIPHQQVNYVIKSTHVPIGFWRSVGHSQNAFFLESFIDEMAHASGTDPYQLRRRFLAYHPTYFNVLNVLAEKSHWEQVPAKGHYRGMAIHHSFGSTVGEVAEISVTPTGEVKVHRVTCVVDCGAVVNPNTVEAQMESAIIYGLGALKQAITIKNGQVEQSNFHNYPLITLAEAPAIEVHIIPSEAPPGGVGEPGTPPIIPAVTNALFAATGKRVRHLPL